MYGIFTYIWLIFMVSVGKYTIHEWYGLDKHDYGINIKNTQIDSNSPCFCAKKGTELIACTRTGAIWKSCTWISFQSFLLSLAVRGEVSG